MGVEVEINHERQSRGHQQRGSLHVSSPSRNATLRTSLQLSNYDVTDNGQEPTHHYPHGVMLGVILGVAVGILVVLAVLLALVLRRCYGKGSRRSSQSSRDSSATITSYSAPSTRSSSPHVHKKLSGGTVSALFGRPGKAELVRSITMDTIPDFNLPQERIQPYSPEHDSGLDSMLQFQYNLLGHLQPDRYSFDAYKLFRHSEDMFHHSQLLVKHVLESLSSLEDENEDLGPRMTAQILFSMVFDAGRQVLSVTVVKAKNIMGRGRSNSPRDPFVKLYLLPDEKAAQQTRVVKKTLTPIFNETFQFPVGVDEVNTRTLRMSVYDVDKRRIRHSLGHVFVPLGEVDLTQNETQVRDLLEASQSSAGLGDICFSLTYNPTAEKLKVVVLRVKGIRERELSNGENIYVRVQMLHGLSIHKARKSSVQPGSWEPSFNESFGFTIPCRQLEACSIRLSLMLCQQGLLTTQEREYGRVTVGSYLYARGEQNQHWQDMIANSRTPVTRCHTLEHPPRGHASK